MSHKMKEKKTKKPDQVVFNTNTNKYDAAIVPYATNVGAPSIKTEDITAWKNSNVEKVNHHFKCEYDAIKDSYNKMMQKFEYNNIIYGSKFSFEPVVGQIYHLYRSKNGATFLSLISPEECSWDFTGSFRLNADKMWEKM